MQLSCRPAAEMMNVKFHILKVILQDCFFRFLIEIWRAPYAKTPKANRQPPKAISH